MKRGTLSPEIIFKTSEKIADRFGYASLSLGRIAKKLHVRVPSLYKHIDGLNAVQEHLARRGLQQLNMRLRTIPSSRNPRRRLILFADEYRAFAREHPGLYDAFQLSHVNRSTPVQSEAQDLLEQILALLDSLNVKQRNRIHAARSLRSSLHGFITLEKMGGFGLDTELDASFKYMINQWLAA